MLFKIGSNMSLDLYRDLHYQIGFGVRITGFSIYFYITIPRWLTVIIINMRNKVICFSNCQLYKLHAHHFYIHIITSFSTFYHRQMLKSMCGYIRFVIDLY